MIRHGNSRHPLLHRCRKRGTVIKLRTPLVVRARSLQHPLPARCKPQAVRGPAIVRVARRPNRVQFGSQARRNAGPEAVRVHAENCPDPVARPGNPRRKWLCFRRLCLQNLLHRRKKVRGRRLKRRAGLSVCHDVRVAVRSKVHAVDHPAVLPERSKLTRCGRGQVDAGCVLTVFAKNHPHVSGHEWRRWRWRQRAYGLGNRVRQRRLNWVHNGRSHGCSRRSFWEHCVLVGCNWHLNLRFGIQGCRISYPRGPLDSIPIGFQRGACFTRRNGFGKGNLGNSFLQNGARPVLIYVHAELCVTLQQYGDRRIRPFAIVALGKEGSPRECTALLA